MTTLTPSVSTKRKRIAEGPPGKRAYIIGDVHGCYNELIRLLGIIELDNKQRPPKSTFLIFLGDLIDRGPDSRQVVDLLLTTPPTFAKCIFVKGNHEDALIRALRGETKLFKSWLEHGGYQTARSYGVPTANLRNQPLANIEYMLVSAVPESHVDFMDGFVDSAQFGDFLCVHAGINPHRPIRQQIPKDLRWIRSPFLESKRNFEKVIIHGHTIVPQVEIHTNRIAVDTGAYETGILSAVRVEDNEVSILNSQS